MAIEVIFEGTGESYKFPDNFTEEQILQKVDTFDKLSTAVPVEEVEEVEETLEDVPEPPALAEGQVLQFEGGVDMPPLEAIDQVANMVDPGATELMKRFAYLESTFDPDADSGIARGLFQFTDNTWKEQIKKSGSKYGLTEDNSDPTNPFHAALMAAERIEDYKELMGDDHEATAQNVYMLHLLGRTGGSRFLKGYAEDPDADASTAVSSAAIRQNPGVFKAKDGNQWGDTLTLREVMERLDGRIQDGDDYIPSLTNPTDVEEELQLSEN